MSSTPVQTDSCLCHRPAHPRYVAVHDQMAHMFLFSPPVCFGPLLPVPHPFYVYHCVIRTLTRTLSRDAEPLRRREGEPHSFFSKPPTRLQHSLTTRTCPPSTTIVLPSTGPVTIPLPLPAFHRRTQPIPGSRELRCCPKALTVPTTLQ